jgi:hypothetical protein
MQQRRLAHMRFLGELYSYKHIDSSVVFDTLYLIIVFGHGTPEVSNSIIQQWLKDHCYHQIHFLTSYLLTHYSLRPKIARSWFILGRRVDVAIKNYHKAYDYMLSQLLSYFVTNGSLCLKDDWSQCVDPSFVLIRHAGSNYFGSSGRPKNLIKWTRMVFP